MNTADNNWEKTWILSAALVISIVSYIYIVATAGSVNVQLVQLEEWYGFLCILLLFKAVLAGPLYRVFPNFPYKQQYYKSLSGLGIACFYFALLHSCIAFFGLLQGFRGLPFLNTFELISVIAGFVTLLILSIMAATSWNWMMQCLGPKWKIIHRFVYLAIGALIVHVLLIGSNYTNFSGVYAVVPLILFLVLLLLYAASTRKYLFTKMPGTPRWLITLLVSIITLSVIFSFYQLHILVIGGHHHG